MSRVYELYFRGYSVTFATISLFMLLPLTSKIFCLFAYLKIKISATNPLNCSRVNCIIILDYNILATLKVSPLKSNFLK